MMYPHVIDDGRNFQGFVYHADALELCAELARRGTRVDAVIVDPPYGCGTQVSARRSPEKRFKEIEGVDSINTEWLLPVYRVLKPDSAIYCFAKWVNVGEWKRELESVGFHVGSCIVWDKMQHGTGDLVGAYGPQYELILFGTKGRHILRGSRPVDIIRYPKVQPQSLIHPYEKPTGLLEKLIYASSDSGDMLLDCFCGSGTTALAARNTGRRFIVGDSSAEYVNVTLDRLRKPFEPRRVQTDNNVDDLPLFSQPAA